MRRFVAFSIGTVAVTGLTAALSAMPSTGLAATARPSPAARPPAATQSMGQALSAPQNANSLNAVSSSGGWAVGPYDTATAEHTLIEHWTGQAWAVVPSSSPGRSGSDLLGVAAVSSSNAWAVGYSFAVGYGARPSERTLIEHWNGSTWKQVAGPKLRGVLQGVAAVSPRNAWAVGAYEDVHGCACRALIEHWNGRAWKIVPSPKLGGALAGVAAVSPRNAWAVGTRGIATLIEHWNGRAWKVVPSPNRGRSGSLLLGVAASSSTSAWAVGISGVHIAERTLIEHWNGRAWKVVPSPNPGGRSWGNVLFAVAAASPRNVWAVGTYRNATTGILSELTLIEHWNGRAWTQVPSPNPGGTSMSGEFSGVAAVSSRSAWAVGSYLSGRVPQTLIAHWNGRAWTQVPSPNR